MVRGIFPSIRQHETHRQLVGRARPNLSRRRPGPDAIVVPASRPATNLDHAITLARAVDCKLVIMCSRQAKAAEVGELLAARSFTQAVVADIPSGFPHPLLEPTSSRLTRQQLPSFCKNPNGDLSVKRNLGLLVGRMMGWERLFFMDDDIRDVAPADLHATVAMLGRYRSVGMRVADFPDNSVVCHAHRETGAAQDIFVSGSVLAVNCFETDGFFPEIYNEDWLFFYDDAYSNRLGGSGRDVTQLHYDPFDQPRRAEQQEFGDVLAEGLYALLHRGAGFAAATQEYWKAFLAAREEFLSNIVVRAAKAPGVEAKLIDAVEIARNCLVAIEPSMCANFIKSWRDDLRTWMEQVRELPHMDSAEAALKRFGLESAGNKRSGHDRLTNATARKHVQSGPVAIPQAAAAELLRGQWGGKPARGRHRKMRPAAASTLRSPSAASTDISAAVPGGRQGPADDRIEEQFGPEAKAADLLKLSGSFQRQDRTEPIMSPLATSDGCTA